MQGSAFLGPKAGEPRRYVYAARDFHDGADFDTSRMVRDARFHYIRNFMPHIGWDAIQYSWQKAPYMLDEWRQQAEAGKLKADTRQACFFRRSKPVEELYDMQTDPWQMHNLAGDPQQRATLQRLRAECERWMVENRDLGLLSQYELYARSEKDSPLEMGTDPKRNPVRQLLDAANLANRCDAAAIPRLRELLKADDGAVRRWGAIGLLALGAKAAPGHGSPAGRVERPGPRRAHDGGRGLVRPGACRRGRAGPDRAAGRRGLHHPQRNAARPLPDRACRPSGPAASGQGSRAGCPAHGDLVL